MHNCVNKIITITANKDGNILNKDFNGSYLFDGYENIFDMKNLKNHKNILNSAFPSKKLIINLLTLNYSVYKLPLQINGMCLFQYIFEEWRMNNLKFPINMKKNKINNALCNINNFIPLEKEIIYSLLCGFIQDKEIYQFLKQFNCKLKNENKIKYTISLLYEKFETNNRNLLIQSLRAHNLDMYLPESLFPPGIYDFF